jgi:hypothetical protein
MVGLQVRNVIFLALTMLLVSIPSYTIAKIDAFPGLNMHGEYGVYWNGIRIGKIEVEAHEQGDNYSLQTDITSSGIARVFAKSHYVALAKGKIGEDYTPTYYYSENRLKKEKSYAKLEFNEQGELTYKEVVPADDPAYRPDVANNLMHGAADPISTFYLMRKKVYAAYQEGKREVSLNFFDGKRLSKLDFTIQKPKSIYYGNQFVDTIPVHVKRSPLAGYTEKEIRKHKEGEPGITFFMSKDESFTLLTFEIDASFGWVQARLVDCNHYKLCKYE